MRRFRQTLIFTLVLAGFMILLIPAQSIAFDEITWGDDQSATFYGFFRNNLGMFLEDHSYVQDDDKLATVRTWLRVYADIRFSESLSLFAAGQLIYEPEYDSEKGSPSRENGEEYSEYDEIDDVLRELYIDWRPSSSHGIRIGRQIVIWGESLTDRVGDVIHPDDRRYTFAFANLEDTRIPSWMIKGIHDVPKIQTSIEWLVNPNMTSKEEYRVNRDGAPAVPLAGSAGQRFGPHTEDRWLPPITATNPILGPPFSNPGVVIWPPMSSDWIFLPAGVMFPGSPAGYVPTALPHLTTEYPDEGDIRFGARTNTFLGGFEFGFSFFHTQNYDPVIRKGGFSGAVDPFLHLPFRDYTFIYPDIDIIGAYMNKDLPVGVLRTEMIYIPNKPYNTFDPADSDAIVERDYVKYMVGWDINGFFYFDWHKSAPFDVTFEHVGEWVPDNDNLKYILYATEMRKFVPRFNCRVSTNWLYNKVATEIIVSYGPMDQDGLIMPAIKYMPAWGNENVSFELKYVGIFGDSNYEGLGILKEKDLIVLTTQISF
ncbi:MAG: hypothetical protein JRH15_22390 [Deltaproteobacteria bacterium]|nr:hypothetical protein [Deltaproteobacteria bacterium]